MSESRTSRPASRITHPNIRTDEDLLPGQKFIDKGRRKWRLQVDSILSLIAFAVDLANIARFPFFCFVFGGAAFLIPYFIFLIFSGFPLIYMELIVGQYVQQGLISVWKIVPIFKGIGYCVELIVITVLSYYLSPLAWSMVFISECIFTKGQLPWTTCDNLWNTVDCILFTTNVESLENPEDVHKQLLNITVQHRTSGEEYFKGRILEYWTSQYADPKSIINSSYNGNKTFGFAGPNGMGNPSLELSLWMLFMFIALFLLVISNIRVTGKFVWGSTTLPYVFLVILFFRALTLPGSFRGIRLMMKPNFTQLLNMETWAVASTQIFYSLGAGFGVHLTHASHNHFNNDVFRDAIIISVVNSVTSIFAACVVFAYLGYTAQVQGKEKDLDQVAKLGIDLIFEAYPDAMGQLSGARFFIILFYLIIVLIGFDTSLGGFQAVVTGFTDEFKQWFPENTQSQQIFTFSIISFCYVCNLMCMTRGGVWMYSFMETYAAGVSLVAAILIQTVVITWIWGMEDLCNAATVMTGRKPNLYIRICWKFIAPISLIMVLVFSILSPEVPQYDGNPLPPSGIQAGAFITYIPIVCIPLYILYQLIYYPKGKNFRERVRLLLCPENEHDKIMETGSAGNRLTLRHLLYFGGLRGDPPLARVAPDPPPWVPDVNSETETASKSEVWTIL